MKKKVLFILGTAHCGSTLLSLILDGSPQCFTVGELSNLPRIYKSNQSACQDNHDFWYSQFNEQERSQLSLGLSNARISLAIPLKVEKFFRELFNDDIFRPYSLIVAKTSADIIVDSTKTIYWISSMLSFKELKKDFDIYLLHLVRDGRAVLNSYKRKRKRMTVEEISDLWLQRVTKNVDFFENFSRGKKMQLAYEKLATNPQENMQKICDFLDIKFQPEMIYYWKYSHQMISGNQGTKSLINKYKDRPEQNYQDRDLSIKLDLSWQTDLIAQDIKKFNYIVGDTNKPYEWHD